MELSKSFYQGNITKKITIVPARGICFRLTFKWAACKLVAGDFNYEPNPNKIAAKHLKYREATLAIFPKKYMNLSYEVHYNEYVETDYREAALYVNTWGKQFKDKNKTTFSSVKVIEQNKKAFWENDLTKNGVAIIGVFYGRNRGAEPFGHSVAFAHDINLASEYTVRHIPTFFDANSGEYIFDTYEDISGSIKKYILTNYSKYCVIDKYNTLILGFE